ncbi:MAG TPA: PIN domain-containing protein [Steroidobacteraceae bacterium]|nr:PIN domain-containing protein [Steroidobacteraceae bacterium]
MRAADTSVVVAAFASWHEHHQRARKALAVGVRLIDHCALEIYSVLTRLPAPHRCAGTVVRDFLRLRFTEPYLCLEDEPYKDFIHAMPEQGISGGNAYDALVAAIAVANAAELLTCDRRAAPIYERYGARIRFIA